MTGVVIVKMWLIMFFVVEYMWVSFLKIIFVIFTVLRVREVIQSLYLRRNKSIINPVVLNLKIS